MILTIISRRDAAAQGKKRYFTNVPCKYGHIAERWVSSGMCKGCITPAVVEQSVFTNGKLVNVRIFVPIDTPDSKIHDIEGRLQGWAEHILKEG